MAKEFDDILEECGGYGPYQHKIIWLVLIPISFFVAFPVNGLVFQTTLPARYWCDVEGRHRTNYTAEEWLNLTVPRKEDGDFETCLQYEVFNKSDTEMYIDRNSTIKCQSGWSHDESVYTETIGTENDWLCDKELQSAHLLSISWAGNAVGTFLLPLIADKYTGRRLMFYISLLIHIVFTLLFMFVPDHSSMMAVRFLCGLAFQAVYQMPYVIIIELISIDKRPLGCFISFTAWVVGMCVTALVVWAIPHWWYLNLIISLPALLFFAAWRVLPESPRWFLSQGKHKECTDILVEIAETNGRTDVSRKHIEEELRTLAAEEDFTVGEVLRHKTVTTRFIILIAMFACVYFCYGCVLINVNIMPSRPFLSFFVLSVIEIPANILSWACVTYLGRKFSNIFVGVMTIVFSYIATHLLDLPSPVYILAAAAVSKIFSTMGIYVSFLLGGELVPTPMRSTGLGTMAVAGLITFIVTPYLITPSTNPVIKYWSMLGAGVIYLILALPLPETSGLGLPQTFHEANILGKDRPLFRWIHKWNQHRYVPVHKREPQENENM